MARKIGQLTVDLRLNSQKFQAGLKKANAGMMAFRSGMQRATRSMGGMQAGLAGLVGVAGLGALIKNSLSSVDALAKLSDRFNISTESLSAFQQLVQLNGSSTEQLEKGLQRMARSIGEAEQGFGTGKRALDSLGISIDQLTGQSADEQFLIIADAIKDVDSASKQAALSSDLFGRAGVELVNTIRQGREGFESAKEEVEAYGLAISRVDAAKIEAANDAILRSKQAVNGLAQQATVQLAPIIENISNSLVESASAGNDFKNSFRGVVENVLIGVSVMKNGITGIKAAFFAVKAGLTGLGLAFSNTFDFLVNNVLIPFANSSADLILAPLKTSLGFFAEYSDTAAEMFNKINGFEITNVEFFKDSADRFRTEFEGALDAIYEQGNEIIPIDSIRARMDEIFTEAETKAKETVAKIQSNAGITFDDLPEEENSNKDETEENKSNKKGEYDFIFDQEKSFQEKLLNVKTTGSKKAAAIQKGFALKEAITTGFLAVQKAVASAPFPLNIPAIALTTAQVAGNIAGIRGQAHDGIDSIPREGTWLLDKGERVVDSRTNQDLKSFLNGGGGNVGTSINATFNVNGNVDDSTMKSLERNQKRFIRMVNAAQGVPA